ncbi:unnamed protein product [Sphagnum troendelagicum]|uniref:Uncharacterized protein n=1 Tax=Sphagnum troendelagicum TaxID=128251 RepID=A0ABP0TLW7_9BRYO
MALLMGELCVVCRCWVDLPCWTSIKFGWQWGAKKVEAMSVLKKNYFHCVLHPLESCSLMIGVGACDWGDDEDH